MKRHIVGIDEVGRGPLAGPVAIGACAIDCSLLTPRHPLHQAEDSKQLSLKQREEWFGYITEWQKEGVLDVKVSFVAAHVIDRIGISAALQRALNRTLKALAVEPAKTRVLLDGGLTAPAAWHDQETIIHGDAREPAIALAAIAAKVLRDRKMIRYAKQHPEYGFERHKGYGTKEHLKALNLYGPCLLHRKTFIQKR